MSVNTISVHNDPTSPPAIVLDDVLHDPPSGDLLHRLLQDQAQQLHTPPGQPWGYHYSTKRVLVLLKHTKWNVFFRNRLSCEKNLNLMFSV